MPKFQNGDKVRIIAGDHAGHCGTVCSSQPSISAGNLGEDDELSDRLYEIDVVEFNEYVWVPGSYLIAI